MKRRAFIRQAGYGCAAAAFSSALWTACQTGKSRPNILFIFTDDHACQAISAYRGRLANVAPTPNLDRIATNGIRFDHCAVANSICAPSRATILTGLHSHLNGVIDNRVPFDGSQTTFPKLLRDAGYETALVGKWHLKSEPTGFDYWEVLPGQGHYYNPDFLTPEGSYRVNGYVTDIVTDKALQWLDQGRNPDKPFLMMLQHKAPHREWSPALRHLDLFEDTTIPEPPTLFDDYQGRGSAARLQDMTIEKTMQLGKDLKVVGGENTDGLLRRLRDRMTNQQWETWMNAYGPRNDAFRRADLSGNELVRWKYQRYLKDYLRCIRAVDENVGRVLDYLDRNHLADNTVVVYSSDQGFYLGEHGWFDKRFMYRESYRTPLLVQWPGVIQPGSVTSELSSNLDFAQTFLDIAGVPAPSSMQGQSLLPLLRNNVPSDWRSSLYYHYYEYPGYHDVRRHEGVATKRYKLIHFYNLGEWELYDLQRDPQELSNVYSDSAYQTVVDSLKAELERLKRVYRVPESYQDDS
jgi:arylsulfatase A-like enzyme